MIQRKSGDQLCLSLQVDHARFAGEIAAAWGGGPFQRPVPLEPVVLAAAMHDAGWSEWRLHPRLNPATRRPYDFLNIPMEWHSVQHGGGVQKALAEDRYAGLLISLHAAGLYKKRYGYMDHLEFREVDPVAKPVVDRFLAEQEALQARLMAELKPDPAALWTHYRWLQAWDMISLVLCMIDPNKPSEYLLGTMPHYPGGPEEPLTMLGLGDDRFTVTPWPFQADRYEWTVPQRWIADRDYDGDADYQEAFRTAPVITQRFLFAKS